MVLLALGTPGCLGFGPGRDAGDIVAPSFSDDDEREIGLDFDRALVGSEKVILDPVVTDFMQRLGQSVVDETGEQPFVYRFRVIEDPSLNAFAMFGGYIYFHSGTLLAASDLDELAGVMGHEVAHVRMRHHSRMEEKTALPSLLSNLAGLGASIATAHPGPVLAAQAVNVALQLHWSRGHEAEADQYGAEFSTRAGYDPAGITRFFDRILALRGGDPHTIPPYLFSHPAVDERIEAVEIRAATLEPGPRADPDLELAFEAARERLALLLATNREHWFERRAPGALFADEESVDPFDPAIPFRRGEALLASGDAAGAVAAFRETIRRDPTRALVFFRLGEAYEALGERSWAVWAYEHAVFRAAKDSGLQRRAEWEVVKLTFPAVREAGLRGGRVLDASDAEQLFSSESEAAGTTRLTWWARLGEHYAGLTARMTTRWTGPGVPEPIEVPVGSLEDGRAVATLALDGAPPAGPWLVTLEIDGDVIDQRTLELAPISAK